MSRCSNCSRNALGYCVIWQKNIPIAKVNEDHECEHWRMKRDRPILDIIQGFITTHDEHRYQWVTIKDMITGELNSSVRDKIGALQVLWTAPYVDIDTRSAISMEFIPF